MRPSTPIGEELRQQIVDLKRRRYTVKEIVSKTGVPEFRITQIWKAFRDDALGISSALDEDVSRLTSQGLNASEIAERLGWSVHQIRLVQYRQRVSGKILRAVHNARPPERRRTEITPRDYEIWRQIKAGQGASDIANHHAMSRARVYQIIADVDARIAYWQTIDLKTLTDIQRRVIDAAVDLRPLTESL
jgi:DNA-binding CsgD family transcriptional regulator